MAINFLNKVDFNQNELDKARIVNEVNDTAAGVPVDGQLYYNTTDNVIKVGEGGLWVSISGDITEVQESTVANRLGIDVVNPTGPIPIVGLDIVGLSALGVPASNDSLVVYDATAATNKKLTVADIISTSTWLLEGDGANQQTIANGDIVDIVGGTYLTAVASSPSANNFEVKLDHDLTTRPADSTNGDASPGYGGTFTMIDSVTTNSTGHVILANLKTITLPADTNETYTLPTTSGVVAPGAPTTGIISLTAGGTGSGVKSTVTFTGTSGRVDISGSATGQAGAITVDLTSSVVIKNNLTVGTETGVGGAFIQLESALDGSGNKISNKLVGPLNMTNEHISNVKTGILGTDAVNLAQVELLVAGVGVFQGGYDASTDPGTPAISGSSNVALDQGDYFVVTAGGDITFSDTTVTVEVGDFIFANAAITASSNPASTQYTIVIADDNIATANTTAANTQKGVAGFDSAYFDVTVGADAGWVQLNPQRNPYGYKQLLNNTAPSSNSGLVGGLTTFTIDITQSAVGVSPAWKIFGTGADAENVKVEVTTASAPFQTVYADVERSGSATLTIAFTGTVANDAYQVLLTHI